MEEVTVIPQPIRLSYSSIKMWQDCPAKWAFNKIDRLPDEPGPAAKRGTRLHKAAEKYLKNELDERSLPVELLKVLPILSALKGVGAVAEESWVVDRDWQTGGVPLFMAVVDVHYFMGDELHVKDLKSGKQYPAHLDQLQLYAVIGMHLFPKVNRVHVSAIYIDEGREGAECTYERAMLPDLSQVWIDKATAVHNDGDYLPLPEPKKCRWCAYSKMKGGPCEAACA